MKTEEYRELLKDGRWQRRRLEIMQRDDFKCRECGMTNDLNVHHIRYVPGRKPWEYDDGDLVTLCGNCHKAVHESIGKMHYDCAKCKHYHGQYLFGDAERQMFEYDGECKEFGGIGCNYASAVTCEHCAFQEGCSAKDDDIACNKFREKTCLTCTCFEIGTSDSYDGLCAYTGEYANGSDTRIGCSCKMLYYSPIALSLEDLQKEFKKRKY